MKSINRILSLHFQYHRYDISPCVKSFSPWYDPETLFPCVQYQYDHETVLCCLNSLFMESVHCLLSLTFQYHNYSLHPRVTSFWPWCDQEPLLHCVT